MKIILLIIMVLLVNGCAISEQFKSRGPLATLEKINDQENGCDLFIIRSSSMLGAAIKYTVALDYLDIAVFTIGDSISIKISPGSHMITAKYPRQMFLGTAESALEIKCKPIESIYIYMTAGIKVGLKQVSVEEGSELYKDSDAIELHYH